MRDERATVGGRSVMGEVDTHKDLHVVGVVDAHHDRARGNECFPITRHDNKQMLL
jgi:hypothetical protein